MSDHFDPLMKGEEVRSSITAGELAADDLSREVYCILGMPIDAIRMASVLRRIETAAATSSPLFLSTPNLNFLMNSRSDDEFRESLLLSDLCPADGISIVWLARLIGIPIEERVAGSDILRALKASHDPESPLRLFLFGGAEGVAAAASQALNNRRSGVCCVGALCPGFGSVEEMSKDEIINEVNSNHADFLLASLGSRKGQMWLKENYDKLTIPVRSHLGAALNFEAGTVKRAPLAFQRIGLEWLWRVKEEPYLWRRYWNDARLLLRLLVTHFLPLAVYRIRLEYLWRSIDLRIEQSHDDGAVTIRICGAAIARHMGKIIPVFRSALATKKRIEIDFSNTCAIDPRFLGSLLMLRKRLNAGLPDLSLTGLSPDLKRIFRLNGVEFLYTIKNGI